MALTREFKELVQQRVERDPAFDVALLRAGIDTMLAGDVNKPDPRSRQISCWSRKLRRV